MNKRKKLKIPYCQALIEEDEIKEVIDTLRYGWMTMGPKTIKLEKLLAKYLGVKHVVVVSSCTAALHLSLIALGIKKGDEVITTPFTFVSTANVIIQTGAKPVFVDIKRDTYDIDPKKIEKAINKRTKAIIPVDYAGQPCDLEAILDIAKKYNLFVIEDAAHTMGAEYKNKKIGNFSTTTCFSFYATKNMTTCEGGAIATNNSRIAEKVKILRLHGMDRDAWRRYSEKGSWYYEIRDCGWKYNLIDMQAAIGIHQLKKIDKLNNVRRKYAEIYNKEFKKIKEIIIPPVKPNVKHVYYLYPILLKTYDREKFIKKMKEKGIGCSVHFIPLHLHPFYKRKFGFRKGDFPNSEWVYEREVSLPLYPKMKEGDVRYVIKSVKEILNY
jgi:dTDP-4-amino-4,6-dideoxygalactose transaminase